VKNQVARGSKLKVENKGLFVTFVFYAIVGIAFLILLPMTSFAPHLAIIGIFSLIAAYGLLGKRGWVIWFVVTLFFVATTFSAFMLYYAVGRDYIIELGMVFYLVLTWIFTVYALPKIKTFKS
jgi:hypothetical protein